jgi:hypothetical protein
MYTIVKVHDGREEKVCLVCQKLIHSFSVGSTMLMQLV